MVFKMNSSPVRLLTVLMAVALLMLQQVVAQGDSASSAPPSAAPLTTASPVVTTGVEAGEVTTVTVLANAFDNSTDAGDCPPDGCIAENTRDGNLTDSSRWSCSRNLVGAAGGAAGEECQITYNFAEAQGVASVSVAFFKGDERTRTLAIDVNGDLFTVIESGGNTSELEAFEVGAPGVLSLGLEPLGLEDDDFLSIIEVEIGVSDSILTPSPAAITGTLAPATILPVADATPAPSPTEAPEDTPSPTSVDECLACTYDDECMECIETPIDREAEYDACMEEAVLDEFCDAVFAPFCCRAVISGQDCMTVDPYVDFLECVVESANACSIDDMTCPGVSGWDSALSPTTDSMVTGSDSSLGGSSSPTPAPISSSSTATSDRDLDSTPSPTSKSTGAGTAVTSESETPMSDTTSPSSSTSNAWLACSDSVECVACVDAQDEYEPEFDECIDEVALDDPCNAIYATYCCNAAFVGDDCGAVETYMDFVDSLIPSSESCSFGDATCAGITGVETAGNSSGAAIVAAGDWRMLILTFTLGLVVAGGVLP